MRINWFASAVPASLALAACGQGDSGNVMAPDVNTLSAAQIDAALGPENGAVGFNEPEPVNETNAGAADSPPASARPAPARRETEAPEAGPPTESAPANDSANEAEAHNHSATE